MRLFAEFYQADVIIASPLGLATALSAAAAEGVGGADFLSSLEIAVVDRADVMLMQNWAHVTTGAGPTTHHARNPVLPSPTMPSLPFGSRIGLVLWTWQCWSFLQHLFSCNIHMLWTTLLC